MISETATGLAPLLIFLAILIFAALGWCMISSCLGQSLGDLWNAVVMSAQTQSQAQPWRQRRDWAGGEFEMDYRGRSRTT